MLSQLSELQPAIPSSFLGIAQAAAASGVGDNIPAEAEERRGVKLRDPPGGAGTLGRRAVELLDGWKVRRKLHMRLLFSRRRFGWAFLKHPWN